jgi:two-component system alkaline phosphatase synthesis response regulator PhoP
MNKARILIVDDDHPTVEIISSILKKRNFEVFTASDGMAGLREALKVKPHLAILATMMPKMDGYELCLHLKTASATARTAVLMLTNERGTRGISVSQEEFARRVKSQLRGFDVGAVEFLAKPIEEKELVRRVEFVLWTSGFSV